MCSSGCFTVDLLEPLPAFTKVPKVPWNAPAYKLSLSARKLAKKDILTQSSGKILYSLSKLLYLKLFYR